jgi:hypothetical protein
VRYRRATLLSIAIVRRDSGSSEAESDGSRRHDGRARAVSNRSIFPPQALIL